MASIGLSQPRTAGLSQAVRPCGDISTRALAEVEAAGSRGHRALVNRAERGAFSPCAAARAGRITEGRALRVRASLRLLAPSKRGGSGRRGGRAGGRAVGGGAGLDSGARLAPVLQPAAEDGDVVPVRDARDVTTRCRHACEPLPVLPHRKDALCARQRARTTCSSTGGLLPPLESAACQNGDAAGTGG